MDNAITSWLNAPAGLHPWLDAFLTAVSNYAIPLIVMAIVLQWFRREDAPVRRHVLISSGLAFALGLAINQLLLLFIHRMRPYDAGLTHLIIGKSADWSFPSDHATALAAIAATFVLLAQRAQAAILVALTLLVCWSRVYLGIHYAGDVLGGIATGTLAAAIVTWAYKPTSRLNRALVKIF